jgi:hypothetical protein
MNNKALLTQTGIVENPNLKPEDEHRATGLHSLEGVAYLLQKDVSDLEDIEILESVGAFHKSRDGAGFYLVNMKDASCSCPGYRFTRSCRHIRHVEERVAEEAIPPRPATKKAAPKLPKGCPPRMTDDQLAARKAKLDAHNAKLREERAEWKAKLAAKKANEPKAFRPINPDDIEVTA